MAEQVTPVMEARGLYHIYRGREVETVALRGAELALERGSWTSIMGPSGSGKSTLVCILAGLVEPTAGSVVVDGEDLTTLPPPHPPRWTSRPVGIILQRANLHPLLSVADNIALPLRLAGQSRGEIQARVEQLLEQIGLVGRRGHRIHELSGGEAQRVALAVALGPRPQVLLADE